MNYFISYFVVYPGTAVRVCTRGRSTVQGDLLSCTTVLDHSGKEYFIIKYNTYVKDNFNVTLQVQLLFAAHIQKLFICSYDSEKQSFDVNSVQVLSKMFSDNFTQYVFQCRLGTNKNYNYVQLPTHKGMLRKLEQRTVLKLV